MIKLGNYSTLVILHGVSTIFQTSSYCVPYVFHKHSICYQWLFPIFLFLGAITPVEFFKSHSGSVKNEDNHKINDKLKNEYDVKMKGIKNEGKMTLKIKRT